MDDGLPVKTILGVILLLYALAAVAGLFAFDVGGGEPDPVPFDETVTVGLTLESELRLEADDTAVDLPRTQVFYSQYPYVVGYYGVERFVATQRQEAHDQQFGHPTTVYVTVFDETVTVTDEGYPVQNGPPEPNQADGGGNHDHGQHEPGTWLRAEDAVYVHGSEARTPGGQTVVPFPDTDSADAFAAEYGGEVISWRAVLDLPLDIDDAATVRERTATQLASADELVERTVARHDSADTLVEVTDNASVQETIEGAPENATVVVPAGTYREHVDIDRPVTLAGEPGAELVGDGTDTVIEITADGAAVSGLTIGGVGAETPGAAATDDHVHDHGDAADEEWDEAIEDDYASGDAGILVDEAANVLIRDVHIDTPASGVLFRDSPDVVVRNITVDGNPNYVDGHMGVVLMRSPGVVEASTFRAGLDGVYLHAADETVVRNNTMVDNRMGVHLMHTSDALIAGNEIRNQTSTGIFVMTGPQYNGLVGNEITDSSTGIDIGGTDSYVARNLVSDNDLGIQIDTTGSVVEYNRIVDNSVGADTRALLPTNQVHLNDFVGNDRHVGGSTGPERIWTHNGTGNYWEGAVGRTDGTVIDRRYSPTDSVDAALPHVDGTPTLVESPGRDALLGVEGAISGMRDGEITDVAPLCEPVHSELLENRGLRPTC